MESLRFATRALAFSVLPLCLACGSSAGPPPAADAAGLDASGDGGVDGATPDAGTDGGRDAATDGGAADASRDGAVTDGAIADSAAMDGAAADSAASDSAVTDGAAGDSAAGDSAVADSAMADAAVDSGPVSMPCTATGACDPFDLTSCAAGEKCLVTATGTACQALTMTPPLAEGATCTRDTDCTAGTWCVSFGGGFVCTATCAAGSFGECGPTASCLGTVGAETCVRVCRDLAPRCDIFTQDCADAADACTLARNPDSGERYTGCLPAGTQARGEACGGSAGRCAPGTICINSGGMTTCRQVCGPDGGTPICTDAAESCTGLARSWGVPFCA